MVTFLALFVTFAVVAFAAVLIWTTLRDARFRIVAALAGEDHVDPSPLPARHPVRVLVHPSTFTMTAPARMRAAA